MTELFDLNFDKFCDTLIGCVKLMFNFGCTMTRYYNWSHSCHKIHKCVKSIGVAIINNKLYWSLNTIHSYGNMKKLSIPHDLLFSISSTK